MVYEVWGGHIVVTYVREGEFPEAYVRRRAQGFAREDIPGSNLPVQAIGLLQTWVRNLRCKSQRRGN